MKKLIVGLLLATFASVVGAQNAVVQSVNNLFNRGQTYISTRTVTLASSPTDVFLLTGSATRTVYVKEISVSCTKTTGGYINAVVYKRSSAHSKLTAGVSPTITALDSSNGAATAVVSAYTSNPSSLPTGTSIMAQYIAMPAPATLADSRGLTKLWGAGMEQHLVLRGTSQHVAVGFDGATTTGAVCVFNVIWVEA